MRGSAILTLCLVLSCHAAFAQSASEWVEDGPANQAQQQAAAPIQGSTQAPAERPPLRGGVEHVETLSPVDSRFQTGAQFDESSVPSHSGANDWYEIPSWFAGKWQRTQETTVAVYDLKAGTKTRMRHTKTARSVEIQGCQLDRKGNVWDYKIAPYTSRVDLGEDIDVQMTSVCEPVHVSADQVVLRFVSTNLRVDKSTQIIRKVSQVEGLQTYFLAQADVIRCNASIKTFGPRGEPVRLEKTIAYMTRYAPFMPMNRWKGMDMRRLFKDFLMAKGYHDLVP